MPALVLAAGAAAGALETTCSFPAPPAQAAAADLLGECVRCVAEGGRDARPAAEAAAAAAVRALPELARQADREVADVDHFLDLALPFRRNFPGFDRNQASKCGLGAAQFIAKNANKFATSRCGNGSPFEKCSFRPSDRFGRAAAARILYAGNRLAS